jgi:IstB-like ATP binding protein
MIFTTNKSLKHWGRVLHDDDLAEAIVDRILERGRHFKLDGPSIRTGRINLDDEDPSGANNQPARISGTHIERTAPFVGCIYTTLVIWFAERIYQTQIAVPPIRPWYPHKKGLCFADVLRAAQRVLAHLDVLDPARSLDNLHKLSPRRTQRKPPVRREAA